MDGFEGLLDALATCDDHTSAGVEFLYQGGVVTFHVTRKGHKGRWSCAFARKDIRLKTYGDIFRMVLDHLREEVNA